MVTEPDDYLRVWWKYMNKEDKSIIRTHNRYFSSLVDMKAWPEMMHVLTNFWDNVNMVFRFGNVELTSTIEEVLTSYESVSMCKKRKKMPDNDVLVLMKTLLELLRSLDTNLPPKWIGKVGEHFHSRLKYETATKFHALAPMIVFDIYRALENCQNGARFFQRWTRPYILSRVLRQLVMMKEIPQVGEISRYSTEHAKGVVTLKDMIVRGWRQRKVWEPMVKNRFKPECSDTYKEWLKKNLVGTLIPGPNEPTKILIKNPSIRFDSTGFKTSIRRVRYLTVDSIGRML
ncbi:hypothetical protein HAX54_035520 [Datura stramonium]|uniref:Uncharacterized protein n=1 Tax=Datura stramonium TaxID=4076 RepID=A0ABS8SFI8_DATST|nr:hypothetical protein [Datura stramonium]